MENFCVFKIAKLYRQTVKEGQYPNLFDKFGCFEPSSPSTKELHRLCFNEELGSFVSL